MSTSGPRSVLVIEDDQDIAEIVQMHLRDAGYTVSAASDGQAGLEQALAQPWDLVILDLSLPHVDGLEVCRRLRERPDYPRVLMLTARTAEIDRILGLEMGADDYLTKPFSIRELLARVKALFRRMDALSASAKCAVCSDDEKTVRAGRLVIDSEKRKVTLSSRTVSLTAKEYDLLEMFACHPGRVYTRSQLLDLIWGLGYEGYEHTVNSHINRLRAKIEKDPAHPCYLLTAWGVGYKFADRDAWDVE